MKKTALFAIGLVAVLSGCSGGTSKATPEQARAFEGAPMPEEAYKSMQESMAKAQAGAQQAAEKARQEAMSSPSSSGL